MVSQEQFNQAIMNALEALKKAKWTHEQRMAYYERVEKQILKEDKEETLSGSNEQ